MMNSTLNSYGIVFFSNNKVFSLILVAVTFFIPFAGLSGLTAVLVSNLIAWLVGFNRANIRAGLYGFNSLLLGLGLGVYYQPGVAYFALLLFASLLTLFIAVSLEGVVGKYGLPVLSIPFLIGIWMVSLASRQFHALQVSEQGIYMMNEMYSIGKLPLVNVYNWFYTLDLPDAMKLYFRSLGAIFFQYYLLPGMLVALGLLIYSRIAFVLSVLGFGAAYLYYLFLGADMRELSAGYIGFNFILTSIAIGGFFTVPSKYSFLWALLLTPLISVLLTGSFVFFDQMQLSVYSLPFNLVVLLFLYVLKFREKHFNRPQLVTYQHFSPEKNIYSVHNYRERFGDSSWFPLSLPFIGTWSVTQGHSGEQTHQGEWRHAWDFEITDEEGKKHKGNGSRNEDYYSFGKPVIAPADGVIEELENDVDDNLPGHVDLEKNWGNAVVIRHSPQLFTKITHLKKGSVTVEKGSHVKKGDLLALSGNSGRSPVSHIHFQVQSTPYIGSKTLDYPVSHYILEKDGAFSLCSTDKPALNERVSNPGKDEVLEKAFRFIPGQEFVIVPEGSQDLAGAVRWEVRADAVNNTYIYCEKSRSKAWFRYDGTVHYFTHFEGNRRSLLFMFFLAGYKILTSYYPGLVVKDTYPLNLLSNKVLIFLQDFIAPFYIFLRSEYTVKCIGRDEDIVDPKVTLEALSPGILFRITSGMRGIETFTVSQNGVEKTYIVRRTDEL